MFVVNFDFSDQFILTKILSINIPVILTELLTYPLQRIQTLLLNRKQYLTGTQKKQIQLIFKQMIGIEKFPKFYHGLRYSIDFSVTQMTTKFIIFDSLMKYNPASQKYKLYFNCIVANGLGALLAQSAFNYQIISSSLPINPTNRNENVQIKLKQYTRKKFVPIIGLKYSLSISIINTCIELFLINNLNYCYEKTNHTLNYYTEQILTALLMLFATSFPIHYLFQRQLELSLQLTRKLKYQQGLLGTFIKHNIKGLLLYSIYLSYSQFLIKKQIQNNFIKRKIHQNVQATRS